MINVKTDKHLTTVILVWNEISKGDATTVVLMSSEVSVSTSYVHVTCMANILLFLTNMQNITFTIFS